VQVCRHVLAVNGGGILDGTPMTREDSAFDGGELNYRYWPDYDAGELDELLPVPPGLLSRCLLTLALSRLPPQRQRSRELHTVTAAACTGGAAAVTALADAGAALGVAPGATAAVAAAMTTMHLWD
jgi:hypothetical protein